MSYELDDAAKFIHQEFPTAAWNFGLITNPNHQIQPVGTGVDVCITIDRSPTDRVSVWVKHNTSALEAAKLAVTRMHRKLAGDSSA